MKQADIKSIVVKKWKASTHYQPVIERLNLLKQNFSTTTVNQKWTTDITYIYTIKEGWTYLSSIQDLHTNKIIAWDLGSQYTANNYEKLLKHHHIRHSYSRKGTPYDNACIEAFHAVLKKEEVYQKTYQTYDEALLAIFQYY